MITSGRSRSCWLGQDVDRTGRLDDAAVARTLAVCERYAAACRKHDVHAIRFRATSAARNASNAADLRAAVRAAVEVEVEVLSGDEEAALAYDGVVCVAATCRHRSWWPTSAADPPS